MKYEYKQSYLNTDTGIYTAYQSMYAKSGIKSVSGQSWWTIMENGLLGRWTIRENRLYLVGNSFTDVQWLLYQHDHICKIVLDSYVCLPYLLSQNKPLIHNHYIAL